MGAHLITVDGVLVFQSDKYPTCPPGKVPLSVKDPDAQDLLWVYAERHLKRDPEFSADLQIALADAGCDGDRPWLWRAWSAGRERICDCGIVWAPTAIAAEEIARMIVGGPHAAEVRSIEIEPVVRMPVSGDTFEGQDP